MQTTRKKDVQRIGIGFGQYTSTELQTRTIMLINVVNEQHVMTGSVTFQEQYEY